MLVLVALLACLAPASAGAAEPPPLGQPTDHFASRLPIGEQGVVTLGDTTGNTALKLRRIALQQQTPAGDPPPPARTKNPPEMTGATEELSTTVTDGPTGFVQADLDTIVGSDGALRGALEPGLLVAGRGITSSGCGDGGFCLTWLRPSYDSDHEFSDFAAGGRIAVPFGVSAPTAGTDIALATGTFREAEGPSVVAAWVHTPAGGDKQIHFAHFVAQRDANGRVTGLQLDGAVRNLGAAYTDPSLGATSPAIAVGDFAGTGRDQAAVVWGAPRSVNTTPRIAATLLDGASGAGLQTAIPTQTFDAQDDNLNVPGAIDGQTGPGAVAQRDVRDADDPIDRLIVGPGVSGARYLYRLDVGNTFTAQKLEGPTVATPGPGQSATYQTSNSELDSLGDLDGDGLDELLATPFARFNPSSTDPRGYFYGCSLSPSAICGRVEILDLASDFPELGDGFTVDSVAAWDNWIETAVIDARPTSDQRIAPPAGATDVASMPQVAVSGYAELYSGPIPTGTSMPFFALESINASEALVAGGGETDGSNLVSSSSARRPPRVAGLALDGQVELGDPVQDGYRSLEPSVVLNAPPTHFDVLGDRAYDPNFCYAGNQYLVPPACLFESEYERASSTSTEVSTESSEDWAVSSKVSAEADFGVVELGAEVRAGYGENFTEVNGSSETDTVTVNVKARNTDKIYAMRRAYDTLEYPLYQPGSSEPEYLLATTPHTLSRRWIDSSSPEALELGVNHQPGHILSYPEDLSEAENPFISPTKGTDGVTKTTFGRDEFELSDSSDYSYSLTKSKVDADSASSSKTWNVGATVSGSGGIGFVNVSAEVSGDYSESSLSNVTTTIGEDTFLASTMGGIDESFGETAYTVKPFAYWTDSAALVLDYAVEPSVAPPGAPKTWWQSEYGVRPDLTLNLPRLLDFEEQAGITSDAARFISPGVKILQGPCSSPRALDPDYPETGRPLCLVAQVENYSLKDGTTPTTVEFYDADPDLGGKLIGSDSVVPIGARDNAVAVADWTPDVRYAGTTPRIFAKVEAAGTVREIHEDNNKGFRAYEALPSSTPALHPPEDVFAELGEDEASLTVEWTIPGDLAAHSWLIRAYPEGGGAPTERTVAGNLTSTSIPIPEPDRYRVVVFAVQGGASSAASHPAEPVAVGVASSGGASVRFTKAPAEGGFTGPSTDVSFVATPEDAEVACVLDGQSRPCRSPLRLGGLGAGSHTIQVKATSDGSTASTPMIAWTVDDAAPNVALRPLEKLTRSGSVALDYRGSDLGGSELQRYELKVRRSRPRGGFATDPVSMDRSAEPVRRGSIEVAPGETACVAVRAVDGAGNHSPWTAERCTTRQIGESAMRKDGKWSLIRRGYLSDGHALRTKRRGAALSFALDGADAVKIFAGRCRSCGRLEVQINGRTRKLIDLGQTKRRRSEIVGFDAGWNKRGAGTLRLVSRGGGEVRIDGIAIWRSNG